MIIGWLWVPFLRDHFPTLLVFQYLKACFFPTPRAIFLLFTEKAQVQYQLLCHFLPKAEILLHYKNNDPANKQINKGFHALTKEECITNHELGLVQSHNLEALCKINWKKKQFHICAVCYCPQRWKATSLINIPLLLQCTAVVLASFIFLHCSLILLSIIKTYEMP